MRNTIIRIKWGLHDIIRMKTFNKISFANCAIPLNTFIRTNIRKQNFQGVFIEKLFDWQYQQFLISFRIKFTKQSKCCWGGTKKYATISDIKLTRKHTQFLINFI